VETTNQGIFSSAPLGGVEITPRDVSIPERIEHVWIPFVGPELSASYRLHPRIALTASLTALLFLPGDTPRNGYGTPLTPQPGKRSAPLSPERDVPLGNIQLPEEQALGTWFSFAPNVSVRVDF
jgi:hypothetical protein